MSRRLQRTIGYCLIGLSLLFLRDLIRLSSQFHPFPSSPPSPLSAPLRLNNAWGSILHRFENHPTSATARNRLPWTTGARERREVGNGAVRTWIVTGELEGLHSNGGIGTALRELAVSLAGEQGFEISILVAHPSTMFTVLQRTTVEARLATRNMTLHYLEPSKIPIYPLGWTPLASVNIYRYLLLHASSIDIIQFPENSGIGYFTLLARHTGIAFQNLKIIVGLHGANVEWSSLLNKKYPTDAYGIQLGYFERRSVELADLVVSPSEYMVDYVRNRGWKIPALSFVIPNIVSGTGLNSTTTKEIEPLNELVFFGRLEERKGIRLFVEAVELLLMADSPHPNLSINKITFLGKDHTDAKTNLQASSLITQALRKLQLESRHPFTFSFLHSYGRAEALNYLKGGGRLTIISPLADNSPSTVLECIEGGIRFVASEVGGIPELIREDDWTKVLFPPTADALVRRIIDTFSSSIPSLPIRPSTSTITAAADWIQLHKWIHNSFPCSPTPVRPSTDPLVTICITHHDRPLLVKQLINSIRRQTYSNYEVILVDDGSESVEAKKYLDQLERESMEERKGWTVRRIANSYLGEARNLGVIDAKGDYLLFLDDDDVLKPHALRTLISVAQKTNASALSTWLDEFTTHIDPLTNSNLPHRRSYWFAGQSLSLGLLTNCFGSGNIFVRRDVFEKVGGFSTLRDVGGEDWEFYMRLAVRGYEQLVVPEELIYVRSDPAGSSMKYSMDPWDASFRSLLPLLDDPTFHSLDLSHALMAFKSSADISSTLPDPTADSANDFRLIQGWNGWNYAFRPVDQVENEGEGMGVVVGSQWSMEEDRYTNPYISDSTQYPFVSTRGHKIAAVRSFTSPESMDVTLRLVYSSSHECGDGTILRLIHRRKVGEKLVELMRRDTMRVGRDVFVMDMELREGSTLFVVSEPGESDECDGVEVRLSLTPVFRGSLAWSTLSTRERAKAQAKRQAELNAAPVKSESDSNEVWTQVIEPTVDPNDTFHIALIFDANRFEHAKSVIRSAVHFVKSRKLHFHLIAPVPLHDSIFHSLEEYDLTITTYDHSLCHFYARQVLPFSNPSIHISAHCKMFLSEILDDLDRVLYLDTDVSILSDLAPCYVEPGLPKTLFQMGIDMGDTCQLFPDLCWPIGMHWKVPSGLECGNVPSRRKLSKADSCSAVGELETIQVNGGVILMELERMRRTGFVERYTQSIVFHYREMGGKLAKWGEQDFINSYFRLFPQELEWLDCGCNYQWFGARREVRCGEQPVRIAHAWSHGLAIRSEDPFNKLFHYFLDEPTFPSVPPFAPLSLSAPFSPNTTHHSILHTPNCPTQSHDCSSAFRSGEYGQQVSILSSIGAGIWRDDLIESIESQSYSNIVHFVSRPSSMDLRETEVPREEIISTSDFAGDYRRVCEECVGLYEENGSCTTAPRDSERRRKFEKCLCSTKDSTTADLFELEREATVGDESSWILYMNDDSLFAHPRSLAHLMAEIESPSQIVLFRSNTSSAAQKTQYRKKVFGESEMEGVGFIFHSDLLGGGEDEWDGRRCGRSRLFARISSRTGVTLKWTSLVPIVSHPLARFPPTIPSESFKLSIFLFETPSRPRWLGSILEDLRSTSFEGLVKEVVVISEETKEEGIFGKGVKSVVVSPGSGLRELGGAVKEGAVLFLSDSIRIDKVALLALTEFHLDSPTRLLGPITPTLSNSFADPLTISTDEFDFESEPDPFLSPSTYSQLLPRLLLTPTSYLESLTQLLKEKSLHSKCHSMLLNAIARRDSGRMGLRLLLPEGSLVDRVRDCRVRNWPDIVGGESLPGDQTDPASDPTYAECRSSIAAIMGLKLGAEEESSEVALSGTQGLVLGFSSTTVSDERWLAVRKEEKCLRD